MLAVGSKFSCGRFGLVVALCLALALPASGQEVFRVSVDSAGREADGDSFFPVLNGDGRFVAFKSDASNLADPPPEAHHFHVYVHDLETGETRRVSLSQFGFLANDNSFPPAIDDSGLVVAFGSLASNLVLGDRNGSADVFVRDLASGSIERVSTRPDGSEAPGGTRDVPPSLSADGRFVAFETTASLLPNDPNTRLADVYVYDRETGTLELASVRTVSSDPDRAVHAPALSGDGCRVAFVTASPRLLPDGLDTDEKLDVYVRDLCSKTTQRVSVPRDGTASRGDSQASLFPPALSFDGRFVAFESDAPNLVEGDTNGVTDVFVRDLLEGRTERVSVTTTGEEALGPSSRPSISGDGRFVVFASLASNLVPDGGVPSSQIFVRDRSSAETCRLTPPLPAGIGGSTAPAISRDGRWVAFESTRSDLVEGDTNGARDIFVMELRREALECPPTPTPTETVTPEPTDTPVPTLTPTVTPTAPSATPTPPSPSATPSPTAAPSVTASPTGVPSTPTPLASPTPTGGENGSPTATPTAKKGNGGGCGCEVDPPPRDPSWLLARAALVLAAPAVLLGFGRKRRWRRRAD
ncbi:MAG: hypothetical protein KatS3mg076_3074 [Candidatus Binatia bacterium]|nr:MAG: hypothetical protein KatS3mg076_3074 [Candidatus Binatia bacterium]